MEIGTIPQVAVPVTNPRIPVIPVIPVTNPRD